MEMFKEVRKPPPGETDSFIAYTAPDKNVANTGADNTGTTGTRVPAETTKGNASMA